MLNKILYRNLDNGQSVTTKRTSTNEASKSLSKNAYKWVMTDTNMLIIFIGLSVGLLISMAAFLFFCLLSRKAELASSDSERPLNKEGSTM